MKEYKDQYWRLQVEKDLLEGAKAELKKDTIALKEDKCALKDEKKAF